MGLYVENYRRIMLEGMIRIRYKRMIIIRSMKRNTQLLGKNQRNLINWVMRFVVNGLKVLILISGILDFSLIWKTRLQFLFLNGNLFNLIE